MLKIVILHIFVLKNVINLTSYLFKGIHFFLNPEDILPIYLLYLVGIPVPKRMVNT
jgi:hypothetical protein